MDMLTIAQVAKKFGVTERQADYATRSNDIEPNARVGIIRLFNAETVQRIGCALEHTTLNMSRDKGGEDGR